MPNYSLNNTVPEPPRSFIELGFNNVQPPPTTGVPQGQGVQTQPHNLEDRVVDHSNTDPMAFPENGVGGIQLDAQRRG